MQHDIVLLLDVSASINSAEAGGAPRQFERLRSDAVILVAAFAADVVRGSVRVAVLTFGDAASVVLDFDATSRRVAEGGVGAVLGAIRAIPAEAVDTVGGAVRNSNLHDGLAAVRTLAARAGPTAKSTEVVVLTDGQTGRELEQPDPAAFGALAAELNRREWSSANSSMTRWALQSGAQVDRAVLRVVATSAAHLAAAGEVAVLAAAVRKSLGPLHCAGT